MPHINELKYSALVRVTGLSGRHVNELERTALRNDTGLDSRNIRELWSAALKNRGYSGDVPQMQMQFWGDLGYTGGYPARERQYYENLDAGGGTFSALHSEHTQNYVVVYVEESIASTTGAGFSITVAGAPVGMTMQGYLNERISFVTDEPIPIGAEVLLSYSGGDTESTFGNTLEDFTDMNSPFGIGVFAFAAAGSYHLFSDGVTNDHVLRDLAAGIGPVSYSNDALMLPDFEGVYHQNRAGDPPWYGARKDDTDPDNPVWYDTEFDGGPVISPYPKLYTGPLAENSCLHSNNLTDTSYWTQNTIISAQDQVGLDGKPNTATYLEDASTTARASVITQAIAGSTVRVWVKKEDDETAFPMIAGNGVWGVNINKKTGASTPWVGYAPQEYEVIDDGLWWQVVVRHTVQNINLFIIPAFSKTLNGVSDNTAVGSCVIANCEQYPQVETTLDDIIGMPPIITTDSPVTVQATSRSYPVSNYDSSHGAWYTEYMPFSNWNGVSLPLTVGGGNGAQVMAAQSDTLFRSQCRAGPYDQTVTDWNGGEMRQLGVAYDANEAEFDSRRDDTSFEGGGVYDEFSGALPTSIVISSVQPALSGNTRRYNLTLDNAKAKIDELMGDNTVITVGTGANVVYGYSITPSFGLLVSGGEFAGANLTRIAASSTSGDLVELRFGATKLGNIDQILITSGGYSVTCTWDSGNGDYRGVSPDFTAHIEDNLGQDVSLHFADVTPITGFRVYVATDGEDTNPGTLSEPVKTLNEAQLRIRAELSENGVGDGLEVIVRGGEYQQPSSLALTAADSGDVGAPVVWQGYPAETVRVTGSQPLDPAWFSVSADQRIDPAALGSVLECDLGANGITDYGTLYVRGFGISDRVAALELFADDQPIELARWPKSDQNDPPNPPPQEVTDDQIEIYPTGSGDAASQDALGGWTKDSEINGFNVWIKDDQIDGIDYYFYRYSSSGNNYWTISDTIGSYAGTARLWRGPNNAAWTTALNYAGQTGVVSTLNPDPNPELIEGGFAPIDTVPTTTSFTVAGETAARMTRWPDPGEMWTHGFYKYHYADARISVLDVNTTTNTITLERAPDQGMDDGGQFYVYNILEELTQAGEYYLDRGSGILYYWPDGDINAQDLQVSMLEEPAVTLTGVQNVTFKDMQISATRDQLLTVNNLCSNITVDNCKLLNAGNSAVHMDGSGFQVLNSEIGYSGDSGIRLNGGGDEASITLSGHVIDNNEFHHFGRWTYAYQPAIRIQGGCGHQITQNTMHTAPHAAITFIGNEHVIEYNKIYSCVQKCSDMGAIYCYLNWALQGVSIKYNHIYNMRSDFTGLGVHGIYMDGAASGAEIYANYVVDVDDRGIFIQSGLHQDVKYNILVRCDEAGYLSNEGGLSFINEANANNLLGTLNANNYQSEPWLSAYPQAATIPNNTVDILDPAQDWRVPVDSIFSSNLGWDNTAFLYVSDPSYLDVYAEVANNVEDSDPLFVSPTDLNMQPGSPYWLIPGVPAANWFDQIGVQP